METREYEQDIGKDKILFVAGNTGFSAGDAVWRFLDPDPSPGFGGLSKAVWKMKVVRTGTEDQILQKLFHIFLPTGGTLAIIAAIRWCLSAPWHMIVSRSIWTLLAGFLLGMILMVLWGRVLDDSRRSTWIKELTNLIAQAFLLWFVMIY